MKKKINIEIDGGQHAGQEEKNEVREKWLKPQGYKVIRIWDGEIFENFHGVLENIGISLGNHPPLNPLPST